METSFGHRAHDPFSGKLASSPGVVVLLTAVLFLLSGLLWPEPAAASSRPKVGLVLSGGGARGIAHVGVLKYLEETGVPIDCITGTSMGAIVGGLYASGMKADDIGEVVRTIDWNAAFRDLPDRDKLSFRRKEDDRSLLINLQVGLKDGRPTLPMGLIQGQNLNFILKSLVPPEKLSGDFDELPIPFRAVAADIVAGEAVVIDSGDLATAMRASMSIPGIFAPVEIEGKLLVDGGIVNNLPVDVARDMGAEVLIVVDIGTPLSPREKLNSLLSVTGQITTILVRRNTEAQLKTLKETDILIQPVLGNITSADFTRGKEAATIGYEAARVLSHYLAELSLSEEEYRSVMEKRRKREEPSPEIDFIRVTGVHGVSAKIIEARLMTKAGQVLDREILKEDLDRIYGLGYFERVDYHIVREEDRTGLEIEATKKSWGPNFFHFGLNLNTDLGDDKGINLSTRYTMTQLNRWGAEWRTDLQVGLDPLIRSEFYQPLGLDTRFFLAPVIDWHRARLKLFEGNDQLAEYKQTIWFLGLDTGFELSNWGELRAGLRWGKDSSELISGDPLLGEIEADIGGFLAQFTLDKLDRLPFPRFGTFLDTDWYLSRESLGADRSFDRIDIEWVTAASFGKNTLLAHLEGGAVYKGHAPISEALTLGGFLRLSGLRHDQLRGQYSGLGSLVFYRRMWDWGAPPLEVPIYLGASLEAGNTWREADDISFDSLLLAGSLFLGLDLHLGPFFLAYGLAEGGKDSIYIILGRSF
jgi:NTE family protein